MFVDDYVIVAAQVLACPVHHVFLCDVFKSCKLVFCYFPGSAGNEGVHIFHRPCPVAGEHAHALELEVIDGGLQEGLVKIAVTQVLDFIQHVCRYINQGLPLPGIGQDQDFAVVCHVVEKAECLVGFLLLQYVEVYQTGHSVVENVGCNEAYL